MLLGLAAPHGLIVARNRRCARRTEWLMRQAVADAAVSRASSYSVDEALRFLVARGLDEEIVRGGSMPEPSLAYVGTLLRGRLPNDRPLRALHVGNFVGVSLSYFTAVLRELHPRSLVVSVDPNIRHRGVADPQRHVLALLDHFDLLSNSIVVTGYTLEQWLGDAPEGAVGEHWLAERACEHTLPSFLALCGRSFDAVLLDGNHDAGYLARELAVVRELLRDDGLLVLDDVTTGIWDGIVEVFERATGDDGQPFASVGRDGRVGVLTLRRPRTAAA